jgi:hypothetical protein
VSGVINNYNPTPIKQGLIDWLLRRPPTKPNPKSYGAFERFNKAKFAYGLAGGGTHTFLYSYSEIFEFTGLNKATTSTEEFILQLRLVVGF